MTTTGAAFLLSGIAFAATAQAADIKAEWDPDIVEGGFVFQDAEAFRTYLLAADSIAVGELTEWREGRGAVRISSVLRGKLGKHVAFSSTGGLVKPVKGDKVLVLLASKDTGSVLHSFCAASGLYTHKKELEKLVQAFLTAKD